MTVTPLGMPTRGDRIHRYVTAFCPECHEPDAQLDGGDVGDVPAERLESVRRLPGYLSEADGKMWLVRGCPDHGRIVTLYDEEPEILAYLEQWTAPTKHVNPDTPGNFTPAPAGYLEGLGELQTQHTCILLEDLTDACNLTCPTCFAGSSPALKGVVPVEEILANVDARIARERGTLDVLMLSGGEPTLHPDFARLLDALVARPITRIMVNTNGTTLVSPDSPVLAALAKHRREVEVYLQFDGFDEDTHRHHRGADLRRVKERAIELLTGEQIFTTLTMTCALGVNEHEIGAVVDLALDRPYVTGVSIQPVFSSGRSEELDPLDRLTHGGVLRRLGEQTDGRVTWQDLTALPCSHPHCCSVGYLFRMDGSYGQPVGDVAAPTGSDDEHGSGRRRSPQPDQWRSLVELVGVEQLRENLDLVANRGMAAPDLSADLKLVLKDSLLGLLSESASLTHPRTAQLLANVCDSCDLGVSGLVRLARDASSAKKLRRLLAERVVRITVKPFMDIHTMIEERLLQCCVHVGTRSENQDQCAPFCAVQAWPQLSAQRLSTVASSPAIEARRPLPLVVS